MQSPASQAVTVFDLIARPEAIAPPWWFIGIFWAVGIGLVLLAVLARRQRWRRWKQVYYALFALLWWCIVLYAGWLEIDLARMARAAARDGSFRSVEGCLSTFHPGEAEASKSADASEVWTVGGERFDYGTGQVGFAWHRVEVLGGAVHADSRVNVAYIRNQAYGRNEILRLIVSPHACPRAPDPGGQ